MRTTRFMTWFFLTLSLAILCVKGFRPALEAPLALLLPDEWTSDYGAAAMAQSLSADLDEPSLRVNLLRFGTGPIMERFFTLRRYLTPMELHHMAEQAERNGDVDFMAFAALHLPEGEMRNEALHLTEVAVARDPRLTWLYCQIGDYESMDSTNLLRLRAGAEQAIARDPDNSLPHIIRAEILMNQAKLAQKAGAGRQANIQEALAKRLEWQREMESAFGLPKWEPYRFQRIDLERRVMLAHGWTDPLVLDYTLDTGVPGVPAIREYTKLLVDDLGKNAEAAGRMDDALKDYRTAARFGQRLRLQGHCLLESLFGVAVQRQAYQRLIPALRKAGKTDEAAAVEFAQNEMMMDIDHIAHPLNQTSNHPWAVLLAGMAAMGAWVFLFLSVASLVYVNTRQSIRPEKRGRLYETMTTLENYGPIMLFTSCLVLALVYAPFAENFTSYLRMNASQVPWDQLFENSYPSPQNILRADLPIENPYHGFALYTFAIAAVLAAIAVVRRRRGAPKEPVLTTPVRSAPSPSPPHPQPLAANGAREE